MQGNEYIASSGPSIIQKQYKDHNDLITTEPGQTSKGFMAPDSRSSTLGLATSVYHCLLFLASSSYAPFLNLADPRIFCLSLLPERF
jgi:hypothetical protein